uniref:Uncharacterized protein n=1 Tax=Ceratitis capitata TaxID=7213 RepID=W8C3X2_CERCA
MNGGRCDGCSTQLQPCCRCGRVPSNLAFLKKILNTPQKNTKCPYKYPRCLTLRAGGESIDCLCSLSEDLAVDRRLQTWERELEIRNNLAQRLMQRTGKSCCELLFNRAVTVDGRDKLMMQRLLAHAESRNPRTCHQKAVIKERFLNGCCLMELSSKIPATKEYFEVTGLPAGMKCELIGENCCVRRSGWISSQGLLESIASKGKDIKRVVPFFPDIEYLQIIGKKMSIHEQTEDFAAAAGTCCSPCCLSSNEPNVETCVDEKSSPIVSFANMDEVIDDELCTIETCRAYANRNERIDLDAIEEFCTNDACPAYVSTKDIRVEEGFCANNACSAFVDHETCGLAEDDNEFCTNDTCPASVGQQDSNDTQSCDDICIGKICAAFANYEKARLARNVNNSCNNDTCPAFASPDCRKEASNVEICNKNTFEVYAADVATPKRFCKATCNKKTQRKCSKTRKKTTTRKSVQVEETPSCSDYEPDYYNELICNRAKCHDIFYRPSSS